ncbi:MAG: hypothetical protein B6D59_02960 [Campylobacteraceae bacterium 4484_4]|nr:MAG: hypothetical protein B6D59_02960 [Campylobacteraceae bacterium 4484_4]
MQVYNLLYDPEAVEALPLTDINAHQSILIQIFSGTCDKAWLDSVIDHLRSLFPRAIIAGATTDGEILAEEVTLHQTVLSIATFKRSTLSYALSPISTDESFKAGEHIALQLCTPSPKAVLLFTDGLHCNGEEFVKGFASILPRCIIAGGMAGDNAEFRETFILSNEGALSKSAIGIAFGGESLQIFSDFKLDWFPVGKKMKITHARKNRVYSIDNIKAEEIYKHYLGERVYNRLPETGVEFPLIREQNGTTITRAVIGRNEDGSLDFAGNIESGEYYQFGLANTQMMERSTELLSERYGREHIEAIFVYSCMARRRFLQQAISQELKPFAQMAPMSGFFTYGEFYHNHTQNHLLNQSMTIFALCEKEQTRPKRGFSPQEYSQRGEIDSFTSTIDALSHLITVSTSEYEALRLQQKSDLHPSITSGPVINFRMDFDEGIPRLRYISPNVTTILGYNIDELLHSRFNPISLLHPDDTKKVIRSFKKALRADLISFESDLRVYTKQGRLCHLHIFAAVERNATGEENLFNGYFIDITEQVKSQQHIRYLAYHDPLTSLPNRTFLKERLEEELALCRQKDLFGTLLFLDLDRFKNINDSLGHSIGDKLLIEVARELGKTLRPDDHLCRIGGDEFVILLPEMDRQSAVSLTRSLSERIRQALEHPFMIEGHSLYTSTSIGAAIFPNPQVEGIDDILRQADTAMYAAKRDPNHFLKFYHEIIPFGIQNGLTMENDLREALKNNHFTLHFQPQVDINSGKIIGAEALLRWEHPQKGIISPLEFIPIAEETGLILPLGKWVLTYACTRIRHLQDRKFDTFRKISVNISPIQFQQANFVEEVLEVIERSGIDPKFLELELTESTLINNVEDTITKMHILKSHDLKFSIDDFGTGYSSLSYLKKLPLDILKIDKSFIDEIEKDRDNETIAETIIQMSKNLGFGVIAEGVEYRAQLELLRAKHCDAYQGYLFSRPLPFLEFERLLHSQKR